MNLKVLLPFQVFAEKTGVTRIVAETREGSFGLLPHRLDCVAALVPGILIYQAESGGEVLVAVDEGVLVKTGAELPIDVAPFGIEHFDVTRENWRGDFRQWLDAARARPADARA